MTGLFPTKKLGDARTAEVLSAADAMVTLGERMELDMKETIFALMAAAWKTGINNDAPPGYLRHVFDQVEELIGKGPTE